MLKKITITAFIIIISTFNIRAQDDSEVMSYSLQQCIDYALEHNQNLLNNGLSRQIAEKQVKQTLADGLPQVTGNVDLAYNFKIQTTPIPDFISPAVYGVLFQESVIPSRDLGDPSVFPAQFGTKYTGSATVSIEQMIFNGSYFVGLQAARTFTELSRKDEIKTTIDVIEAVTKAYYSTIIMKERQALVDKNYERLDSLLRDTKALNENGFAENIDVNRILVQFNNIKVEKNNFDQTYELSKALLKFQMGMPQTNTITLVDDLSTIEFQTIESDFSQEFKYSDRIEYSQLETNDELTNLDIKNTKVQYLPRLDLYGRVGATAGAQSTSDLFNFSDNWFEVGVVGVRMNVPIFDGFRKSNIIQQKKIQSDQIQNSFELLKSNIDIQIKQATVNYNRAIDNMAAQKENMQLAEEVFNVSKIKYGEGVGSSLEVTNSNTDYKTAETNYYDALYSALVAKIDLEKAYGRLNK
ncbi:TolC family protein [Fulvivirga lutimaris]|uniref:TolC family protein n=1 Tax=Fulvivirga lutimaris TaxID=1819566 RepID=UPI0012BD6085|nr:TolC family protein [Fulvivirga lutimaris]MTI39951.1 TolC family protein [Fulvivirga lutimaris]